MDVSSLQKERLSKSWELRRLEKHKQKREKSLAHSRKRVSTENEKAAAGRVPLELLARDWLNEQCVGTEQQAFLVENLLPSLVVGLEKLLTEVSVRGLVEDKGENPDFNPINYLAQHLMRNNPKYSNFAEAHPYCRAMREISEELKKVAYSVDNSQLSQLKSEISSRRMEREKAESAHALEAKRREELLKDACSKWILSGKDGLVTAEIQLALQSWLEIMSTHSLISTLTALFSQLFPSDADPLISETSLVAMLMKAGEELSGDVFDSLAEHLEVCGLERKRTTQREQRRALFGEVFKSCDPDKTGFVDRLRVLHLFNCFYDSASSDTQVKYHNPRKWPIVEVAEAEELDEDEERRSTSMITSSLTEEDYKEFLAGTKEGSPSHQAATSPQESQEEPPKDKEDSPVPPPTSADDPDQPSASTEQPTDVKQETALTETEDSETKPTPVEGEVSQKPEAVEVEGTQPTDLESNEPQSNEEEAKPKPERNDSLTDAPPPLRSSTGSVIERRLATADRYGRSAPISVMRRLSGMASHPVSPSGPGSSWDHLLLNCSQFVQLVELFLASSNPPDTIVDSLSSFIRNNYTETAQERSERLELAQQQKLILTKRYQINALFEVWDNDRSGYLELDELQLVLGHWKDFSSEQAQEHAKEILFALGTQQPRLSRPNFHVYIEQLTEGMKLREFEEFSEYLMTSVKLTFEELHRGEKRKVLMDRISLAGKASGLHFTKAMKAAIEAIHQDNAEFGGDKSCSVAMALLEPLSSSNFTLCLRYKAASEKDSSRVVGRKILRSFKQGVSHKAVDSGRPVCVQNIRKHGGVYLFNQHNKDEFNGSLVVSPIITPRESVVGTFSVDSLREVVEDEPDTTFLTHEINFYQGVGVCLGEVFHWIEARQKLLTVSQSALSWVHRRCPQVTQSVMYIVEPCLDSSSKCSYALRCMLITSGPNDQSHTSKLLTREDNIFRDYLFQCVDDSEPVVANAYGQHHLAYPIRDRTGCAVAVLDLYMPPTQNLRPSQLKEVTKVLKLLTLAYNQLSQVPERAPDASDLSKPMVTRESTRILDQDVSVLFDHLMLTDLKQSVSKLDNRVFAEMRSYIDPPPTVLGIVRALLYILYPDNEFETWAKCKQFVTVSLLSDLQDFDPLSCEDKPHKRLDLIKEILRDIQTGSVQEQASHPAKYIYGWVNVCLSLLDHAANKPALAPSGSQKSRPTSGSSTTSSQPE